MVKQKDSSIAAAPVLHLIAVWLVGLILAVVPLFAVRYVFAGIGFEKALLLYGLVTILAVVYVVLVFKDDKFRPTFNVVGWGFATLLVVLGLSTIFSVQPYASFWGAFNRMEGYISWIYYFAFFVIASSVLKNPKDWWIVIRIALIGATLISLYGLGQALHLKGLTPSLDVLRVESTVGNPVFLGGYLASAIPLTMIWALSTKSRSWRNLGLALVVLEVIILFLTFSRGSWIGAILGSLVVIVAYLYKNRSSATKWLIGGAVILVILVGVGVLAWGLSSEGSIVRSWGDKIIRPKSIEYRRTTWSVGIKGFLEKPLIGWGLENFKVVFDKYYQVPPRAISFQESHVDRAHNEYIGIAVSGGILALLVYLWMMIAAVVVGIKRVVAKVDQEKAALTIGLLGGVVAYMAYIFTAFHLMVSILFFLLALAWFNQGDKMPKISKGLPIVKMILAAAGVGVVALSYSAIINPLVAVRAADKGTRAYLNGDFTTALADFKKSLGRGSYMSNVIRAQMALVGSRQGDSEADPGLIIFRKYAGSILSENAITEPHNSYHYLIFGMYFSTFADIYPGFLEQADSMFAQAYALTKGKGETQYRWGQMYARLGDTQAAREKFEEALSIEPYNKEINFTVGTWYLSLGNVERGSQLILVALDWGYQAGKFVEFGRGKLIAGLLESAGKPEVAKELYRSMIDTHEDPQVAVYATVELALLLNRMGEREAALELAQTLSRYDVDPKEFNNLMAELQGS